MDLRKGVKPLPGLGERGLEMKNMRRILELQNLC
jgi:hypothetical protein